MTGDARYDRTAMGGPIRMALAPLCGVLAACLSSPDLSPHLSGRFVSLDFAPVDLTTQGTIDWAHWGLDGPSGFNHKSGVTPAISNYAQLGDRGPDTLNCCGQFSWVDGTPTPTAPVVSGGVMIDTERASGDGFQLTVAADVTRRRLTMYAGAFCVRMRFEATLSGSGLEYSNTSFNLAFEDSNPAIYEIDFNAAAAGEALTIDYTIEENHCTTDDLGEAWLLAATLSETPE